MPDPSIVYSKKQHVVGITLNRPEVGNIVNLQLAQELEEACLTAARDGDAYVVVITGAGDRAFCLGAEPEGAAPGDCVARHRVAAAVASLEQPVIAAINGDALGLGLELALACDIRLASHQARLGLPQITAGLMPIDGGTQRLPRVVGKARALEFIFTGDAISADEALEIGLVSRVVAPEKLTSETASLAESLAAKAPVALRYVKEAVNKGQDLTLDQGLRLEADLYFLLHTTADRTEGIKAFLEKRPPRFQGN